MNDIPLYGLGTWKIAKDVAGTVVYEAIKAGVRHIDCACDYGNEIEVGKGITKALTEGIVKREELWITSKLWNTFHRQEHVELACRKSLADLNIDYFDLYLIHFPIPLKFVPIEVRYPPEWIHDPSSPNPRCELDAVSVRETWTAMEQLVHKKLTRFIGVCNFSVSLLMDLLTYAEIKPYGNQIERHPWLTQQPLVEFCKSRGLKVTAFSSFGSPSYMVFGSDQGLGLGLLLEKTIVAIANKHKKTPAQVLLRWSTQNDIAVIPKSSSIERIQSNMVCDFILSPDEMASIDALNQNRRFNNPGEFCKGMGGAIPIYD